MHGGGGGRGDRGGDERQIEEEPRRRGRSSLDIYKQKKYFWRDAVAFHRLTVDRTSSLTRL